GTTMGGIIVESGKFPWDNGNFPGMTEPSRGYHGVRFFETFGDFGYSMRARMETLRTFGAALSPFNAWLLLQGLETLPVRMERHCENALAVAKFLESHPRVSWVNYPGLPGNKYHKLARKYLPDGASGLLNFGVKGGAKAGEKFIEAATFMSHLANIGDAKTLIIHPASTTHRQMSEEEQAKAGVRPDMIRVSVGLETPISEIPAGRGERPAQLRRQRRGEGGRKIHRGRDFHEPSRQHRRRQDAHHPPRVDDAPANVRGGAGEGGRQARHDPRVGGPGDSDLGNTCRTGRAACSTSASKAGRRRAKNSSRPRLS